MRTGRNPAALAALIWIGWLAGCLPSPQSGEGREDVKYVEYTKRAGHPFASKNVWRLLKGQCESSEIIVAGTIENIWVPEFVGRRPTQCFVTLSNITLLKGAWPSEIIDFQNEWQSSSGDSRPDFPLKKGLSIIAFLKMHENFFPPTQAVRKMGFGRGECWVLDYDLQREVIRGLVRSLDP